MAIKEGWRGYFYEDFQVGDICIHANGRTLLEADNTWFTLLTCNTHQVHYNAQYAQSTEFGKCLMNSAFTLAVVAGMSVPDISENAVANLGWVNIDLPNPVFAGDTLYAESKIQSKRESKSRPNAGIIEVRTRGYNQNGVTVMEYVRTVLIYKREHSPKNNLLQWRRDLAANKPL